MLSDSRRFLGVSAAMVHGLHFYLFGWSRFSLSTHHHPPPPLPGLSV